MSRIKIEDLPAGDNLTPEEELEIFAQGGAVPSHDRVP